MINECKCGKVISMNKVMCKPCSIKEEEE